MKNKIKSVCVIGLLLALSNAAIAEEPVKINFSVSPMLIEPGEEIEVNVTVDPKGTGISGLQISPNFNEGLLNVTNVTEENLFSRTTASYFFSTTHIRFTVVSAVIGPYSYNTNGVFSTLKLKGLANGTTIFSLTDIKVSSLLAAPVAYEVSPAGEVRVFPRYDIDGSGRVDVVDSTLLKSHMGENTSALPPDERPRYDIDKSGLVNNADVAILKAHYGEIIPTV